MANRRFNRLQALQKEVKKLHVKIVTDGLGDVSSISGVGIASVSHAANVYSIVLEDKYNDFLGASAVSSVVASYGVDNIDVQNKTLDLESSVLQASTTLHVELILKNTSVEK